MAAQFELEKRLRGYAQEYDRRVPTTAMLERRIIARVAITPRETSRGPSPLRELALAGLVVVAVALLVVGVARLRAMNQTVTAHPKSSVIISPGIKGVGAPTVEFVSGSIGWIAEMQAPTGPTVLFGTTDAGAHWQQQLTWDGPPPAEMRFSANGHEGLLVGIGGVPLYHTTDGGAHWQRMALPPEVIQGEGGADVYFLSPREGWVLSYLQEATPGFVGLFRTTDSGAHWTRIARLDVSVEFAHGQRGGGIQGTLVFKNSSTGWMTAGAVGGTGIVSPPPYAYMTRDGGLTWQVQTIEAPRGVQLDSSDAMPSPPIFFNARDGLLGLTAIPPPASTLGPPQPRLPQATYLYRTADGGAHWSYLVQLPAAVLLQDGSASFIDPNHWVLFDGTSLIRTSDGGQHWSAIRGGLPSGSSPVQLIFDDLANGWVVLYKIGGAPALYRTTDAGSHWTQVGLPKP